MSPFECIMPIGSAAVREPCDGTAVVAVAGEQDQSNVDELLTALLTAAAAADVVVVDLGDATFVSAAFIGAVAVAAVGQERRGGHLWVRGASPFVRRVFGLCSLEGLLGSPTPAAPADPLRPGGRRALVTL
ncbi:MAG: STAS domain-containing protein [Acidimicrobiia bacterium]